MRTNKGTNLDSELNLCSMHSNGNALLMEPGERGKRKRLVDGKRAEPKVWESETTTLLKTHPKVMRIEKSVDRAFDYFKKD